jgi:hypothetical protein
MYAGTGEIIARNAEPDLAGNNTQLVVDEQSGLLWDLNKVSGLYALDMPGLRLQLRTGIAAGTVNLQGAALDNFTNTLFVVNRSNPFAPTLEAVNASTGVEIGSAISTIPDLLSVAYDSADRMIYALGNAVWIVSPANLSIMGGPIPIAPHVIAWSIVYDPSREFLYIPSNSSSGPPWPGNITVIDGSSIGASEVSYTTFPAGQLPIDAVPVELPGATAPGSSEIWVTNFISGTISIIASPPRVTFVGATPNPADVGATTTLLLGYVGGAGPSTVSYSGLPAGCASLNVTVLNCTLTSPGSYTINATVVDSLGESAQGSTVLSVNPTVRVQLEFRSPGVATGPGSSAEVDIGSPLVATVTVSDGTAPFNFTWSFGDGTGTWGSNTSHTYAAVGSYLLTVVARDAGGGVSSASAEVTVEPLPSVSVVATPSNITDVGMTLTFSAPWTGGVGTGTVSWSFGDGATANGTPVSHAYSAPGTYFATARYTDAAGASVTNYTTVSVHPALGATYEVATGPTSPPLPPGSSVTTGTSLEFTTEISGGTSPYTVVWGFGDNSYGYGDEATHTFATPGTYTVTLFIEDAVGAQWNTSYRLIVTAPSSSTTFGTDFDEGLVLGLLVGAAVAAVMLFVAGRSRSRPPPSPPTAFVPPATTTTTAEDKPWQET